MKRVVLVLVVCTAAAWVASGGILRPCDCDASAAQMAVQMADASPARPCCCTAHEQIPPTRKNTTGTMLCPKGPIPMDVPGAVVRLVGPQPLAWAEASGVAVLRPAIDFGGAAAVAVPPDPEWLRSPEGLSVFLV